MIGIRESGSGSRGYRSVGAWSPGRQVTNGMKNQKVGLLHLF